MGVTYGGFVNGDTSTSLGGTLAVTTTAVTGSPVGSYPITAAGLTSANYTITYVAGTLTVNKATLTVTATNAAKTYGSVNPTLGVAYSAFVNGDTSARRRHPRHHDDGALGSPVGTYPITACGPVDANYTITLGGGRRWK